MLTDFLPTTQKEVALRGWDYVDVILFSGDAYIDHPSFGAAVIGRVLENAGYRVAIVPQPNWRDDLRDFKKLGCPRLFFAVSGGAMDSMVNHYTANRRRRSNDAYTPDGRADMRPDRCVSVYCKILKSLFPNTPVVIGGIEASLRRFTHYDYWSDSLMPSILVSSGADWLQYGMGEKSIVALADAYANGMSVDEMRNLRQVAYLLPKSEAGSLPADAVMLHSHEDCLKSKRLQAENFGKIEVASNHDDCGVLVQGIDAHYVVVNPPYPSLTSAELDAIYDLPYQRMPHPKYKGKTIPAYDMIKFSVCIHRGCFGGCAFCTISAHQGKHITSRSVESIVREVEKVSKLPDYKGYISDLGGPSANMYGMTGRDHELCRKCKRTSCIHPSICRNMNVDHRSVLEVYRTVDALPYVKKSFIGSGVRYDLILHDNVDTTLNDASAQYAEELISRHVSGRLKVAPEHTEDSVLSMMRKPSFKLFERFVRLFEEICAKYGLNQQIIPYFISSHPGCRLEDMAELAVKTKRLNFQLEQVQDFTPTPMTLATEMYYTGLDPHSLRPVYAARRQNDKLEQRQFFFWYKKSERGKIISCLRRIGRSDLIDRLVGY